MKGNRNITEQGTKIGKRKVQKTAKEKLHTTAERITEKEKITIYENVFLPIRSAV